MNKCGRGNHSVAVRSPIRHMKLGALSGYRGINSQDSSFESRQDLIFQPPPD
jgi:hypothetical protein